MITSELRTVVRQLASLPTAVGIALVLGSLMHAGEPDLTAIDKNEDGAIELGEIPGQDLSVISRYASLAGLDLKQPMPIAAVKLGRDRYFHNLDGGGLELQIAGKHEFGRVSGSEVRPFGIAGAFVGRYTSDVRQGTIVTFQKFDANRDGLLTPEELSVVYRSFVQLWMRGDRDGNGVLTFAELANSLTAERERRENSASLERSTWNRDGVEITAEHRSYAVRLMSKFDKNKNGRLENDEIPQDWKTGNMLKWTDLNQDGRITRTEMQTGASRFRREEELAHARKNDPDLQHCVALAVDLIRRFDLDRNRTLGKQEWQRIGGNVASADANDNGLIVEQELATWLLHRASSQAGADLGEGTPNWFLEADSDLDGQVTYAEFISTQSSEQVTEFLNQDRDSDGIVTPSELSQQGVAGKTRYRSHGQRVLEAEKEIYSDIFVPDTVSIVDIDVQVSIVKNGDDDLDLRLIGPDGTTAALYYTGSRKAWGGGRMFENTIIDDEAPQHQKRLPRPPSHRSFRPQSIGDPKRLSLNAFYGTSARGRWRLVVGNKGRSAGLLEGWALLLKPSHAQSLAVHQEAQKGTD